MSTKALAPAGLAAIVVAAAALGLARGNSHPPSAKSSSHPASAKSSALTGGTKASLKIGGFAFAPQTLTVRVGAIITVSNSDPTEHTATAPSGAFDTGNLNQRQSARITLKKVGVYTYICSFHAFMNGTIKVVS